MGVYPLGSLIVNAVVQQLKLYYRKKYSYKTVKPKNTPSFTIRQTEIFRGIMDFGERIRQLRKETKLTQSDLADKLLVHTQTISKWERGLIEPDVAVLGDLAAALGISVDKLLGLPEGDAVYSGKFSPDYLGNVLLELRIERNESQTSVGDADAKNAQFCAKCGTSMTDSDASVVFEDISDLQEDISDL